ncbi:MAG: hypothetical protein AB8H80_09880 [Planctomycetota bacterium]
MFALLDPQGKKLTRGSRSPKMTYGSVTRFVAALDEISSRYADRAKTIQALPVIKNLRLALNVAAADLRPLVILRGRTEDEVNTLSELAASVAWSSIGIGRCHYVVLTEEVTHEGLTPGLGITVVQPETYGRGGKVLAEIDADATTALMQKQLIRGFTAHDVADKHHEQHVANGRRQGIRWTSETKPTDPNRKGAPTRGEERRRRRRSGGGGGQP